MSNDILTSSSNPGFPRRYKAMRDGAGGSTLSYVPTTAPVGQSMWRTTFAKTFATGADTEWLAQIGPLGSGITYGQSGGNLVINSGVTANAELILRSTEMFVGSFEMRWQTILSQRIANNNFIAELVDVIGDSLPLVVNSATSVTVTLTGITDWSAANVGQSISLGAISGVAGVPGRYAIASVAINTVTVTTAVTFTVSGWPASGTGTCSLFGWNFHRTLYTGTGPTNQNYDTGRRGWASGDTVMTTNTTASPGLMNIMQYEGGVAAYLNSIMPQSAIPAISQSASRIVNIADENAALYVQLRCVNGTAAPASTTAWTIGMLSVIEHLTTPVVVTNVRSPNYGGGLPVSIGNTVGVQGAGTHAANISGNAFRIGARALSAAYASVTNGQNADLAATLQGVLVTRPWQIPELEWSYAAGAGGIANTTTAVTIRAAAGAGLRSYITGIQLMSQTLTTATELVIRDGAGGTVIWRHFIPTTGCPPTQLVFENPLRSTANALLEVATLTASGAGAVYINVQGFTAA